MIIAAVHISVWVLKGYITLPYSIATSGTWDIILLEIPANDQGRQVMVRKRTGLAALWQTFPIKNGK